MSVCVCVVFVCLCCLSQGLQKNKIQSKIPHRLMPGRCGQDAGEDTGKTVEEWPQGLRLFFGWFSFSYSRSSLLEFTICIQSVAQIYNSPFPQKDKIAEDEDAFDEETKSECSTDDDDDDEDEVKEKTEPKPERKKEPAGSSDRLEEKSMTEKKTAPVPTAPGTDSGVATSTKAKVTKKDEEDTRDTSVVSSPSSGSSPSASNILMSWI